MPTLTFGQDEDTEVEQADQQEELSDDEVPTYKSKSKDKVSAAEQSAEGEKLRVANSSTIRRFHEVLDELLAEFGYDIKLGQIKGLSNLSFRKVRVSKSIPRTYEDYVEMLLTERIRDNSQIRMLTCVPCKTRTSALVEGKLMVTSPATNVGKLESAAAMLGIEHFMDAVLVYHTTHMVLAVNIFNAKTKELLWARTYNSETIKSRYQKLAVDYSQVAKARPGEDYVPDYRFLIGLGGGGIPNVGGSSADSTMLNLQIRATEKFNNRRTEFGMLLSVYQATSALVKEYPSEGTKTKSEDPPEVVEVSTGPEPKPFKQALGIYGLYSHSFLGAIESYNNIRHSLNAGAGIILATGYFAPTARLGWDIFMGRRFSTNVGAVYIGQSTILVDDETVKTKGGFGGDLVISLNY
jgi:hypothetical protein